MRSEPSLGRSCLACAGALLLLAGIACLCSSLAGLCGTTAWWVSSGPVHSSPQVTVQPAPTLVLTALPIQTPEASPSPARPTPPIPGAQTERHLRIFTRLWESVRDAYVYPDYNGTDWDEVGTRYRAAVAAGMTDEAFWVAMSQMIDELQDDHSAFLSPEQVAEEDEQFAGQLDYVGIGVYVSALPDKDYVVVLLVFPDTPAERAGIQPHDRLLSANGQPLCCDAEGYDALDLLLGTEGSSVNLSVQTPGQPPRVVTLHRARVQSELPVVTRRLEGNIGYLLIPTFWDETIAERTVAAWRELSAAGPLDGLVIDMRINSGGAYSELYAVLALFADGELGHFVSRAEEHALVVGGEDIRGSQRVPLVILVGRDTASYGEIFSGALREAGRARIVGQTTDGNVETVYPFDFEDGSRAWIAEETFVPPSGTDWEETGIVPDVEIALDWDEFTTSDDPQLQAALDLLR